MRLPNHCATFYIVGIFALPAASLAAATSTPTSNKHAAVPVTTTTAASAGMRAYIDPQTGKLVGHPVTTQQKRAATQAKKLPTQRQVQEVHHTDGSIEFRLNGLANAQEIATVGADGKIHLHCTDAAHEHLPHAAQSQSETRDDR